MTMSGQISGKLSKISPSLLSGVWSRLVTVAIMTPATLFIYGDLSDYG